VVSSGVLLCAKIAPTRLPPMTPKIVHVNTARGYRGGERQTELLIRGLATCNVRQALVARRGGLLAARIAALGIEVREVAGGLVSVTRAIRGAALVHVHEGRSVYAAYLRSLLSGTPYVITRRVNNPIRQHWFAHRAYRRAVCVAAVAPQVAEIIRAYDAAIPVRVVHSGSSNLPVNADTVATIRARFPGKLVVGHVGALDNEQKGQEFIIAVARELESSHSDLQFVFVGGGDDEAMLKAAATGLTNVTFTGFVDNVGDYLAAFDIFVLPSNREGIGSILFDAMDRALPVVASRVGGVPDIVRHGENGLLIEAANVGQLRDAILELRANPELRRKFGECGRELAKEFTGEAMWRKYLALYESAIGRVDENRS
jgi:glycosyltransferase involved in cell wall biosynthesis